MSEQTPEVALDSPEPTMEDILASIREIIADDEGSSAALPDPVAIDALTGDEPSGNVTDLLIRRSEDAAEAELPNDVSNLDDLAANIFHEQVEPQQNEVEPLKNKLESANALVSEPDISGLAKTDTILDLETELQLDEAVVTQSVDVEDSFALEDFDLESELSDISSIEIPEPETAVESDMEQELESLLTETLDASPEQTILEQTIPEKTISEQISPEQLTPEPAELKPEEDGMPVAAISAGLAGVGAGIAGARRAMTAPEAKVPMSAPDIAEIEQIDADLSSLLDEDITIQAPSNAAISTNTPIAAVKSEVDLTQDDSLDLDLSMMLVDVTDTENALGAEAKTVSTDRLSEPQGGTAVKDELEALLAGIDTDSNVGMDAPADLINTPEIESENADFISDDLISEILSDTAANAETFEDNAAPLAHERLDEPEEDADLKLVKSLMADLVDSDPISDADNVSGEADAEALLSDMPDIAEHEDGAILDEILGMRIEDEIQSNDELNEIEELIAQVDEVETADDVVTSNISTNNISAGDVNAQEVENIAENLALHDDVADDVMATQETGLGQSLSLADIAAAARADAHASDIQNSTLLSGVLASTAVAGGIVASKVGTKIEADIDIDAEIDALADDDFAELTEFVDVAITPLQEQDTAELSADIADMSEVQSETAQTIETLEHMLVDDGQSKANDEDITKERSDMPRAAAKKEDIIMDDVTETATANVFAELNQVVEEKAMVAERGDRIGDLVMEALRPMLKDWLDANLKGIVERAVTKEVKRISAGK